MVECRAPTAGGSSLRETQPDDAIRVAGFILDWLTARNDGLDAPSRRIMAGRIAAGAQARPGSQLFWEREGRLVATCSIQNRDTVSGLQALLQLRIDPRLSADGSGRVVVDEAFEAARQLVPQGRIALVVPGGDHLEVDLVARRFEPTMALLTLTRPVSLGTPAIDPPTGTTIRSLRPGLDEEGYAAVQREAFHTDPFGSGMTAHDVRNQLAIGVVEPDDFFLAEMDGQLVGVARVLFDADGRNPDGGPFAEIVGNGVLPEYRRHGIGQALVRAQIARLHGRGATTVTLTVISLRPELVEHYHRAGFAESGRQTIWLEPDEGAVLGGT